MPGAVQVFSRALNVSEAELFKLMEQGKLLSADVLPKVAKEFRKSALEGGAFDKALQGLRVTEGQFITGAQRAGDTIFKSGFSEGLSELYKTMSEIFKDAGPQLEKIGDIFGKVFKGIAYVMKLLEPPLKLLINNFEILFGAIMIGKLRMFSKIFKELTGKDMIGKLAVLRGALATTFLPITVALAAAEELISLFSDKLVGVTEKAMGYQVNLADGTKTNLVTKDGKLMSDPNTTRGLLADPSSGNTALANMTEEQFDKLSFFSKADLVLEQIGAMQADMMSQGMQNMFWDSPKQPIINQTNTIKVEGVSGEDVAYKVKRHLAEFTGNGGGR